MKYLKPYNEAAIDFLKPKSNDEILNILDKLTPEEKIKKGSDINLIWLIEIGLNEGGKPSKEDSKILPWAIGHKYNDFVLKLLDYDKIDPGYDYFQSFEMAAIKGNISILDKLINTTIINNYLYNYSSNNGKVIRTKVL